MKSRRSGGNWRCSKWRVLGLCCWLTVKDGWKYINVIDGFLLIWGFIGSRKKVQVKKSLNRRKVELCSSRTFFLQNVLGSYGRERCYRQLIYSLQMKLTKKINLKVECYSSHDWLLCQNKSKHVNEVELSCAKLSRSCSWYVGLV